MEPDSTGYEHPLLSPESIRLYREALSILTNATVPHLVGGAYAYARYTGIERHTKDFDVFICKEDFDRAAQAFEAEGYRSELTFPHWLGKAYGNGEDFVDLIFSAGNGVAKVDMRWFEHAVTDKVFAGLAAVILIGLLVENLVFASLERVTVKRWGMQR